MSEFWKYEIFCYICIIQLDQYILYMKNELETLLMAWEETYKKGQLTLWIFLSLQENMKYVEEIRSFVEQRSNYTMTCEEQSLYRVLRKFEHVGIVNYELRKGYKGPERKYYYLTNLGKQLFKQFVERNIQLFYSPEIKSLLTVS